ncbi:YceD family protein [Thermosynechococcus sp. PP45]|uniref:YceD family protein n=1 Tax=unclassified Thermosynechococcus TaxID=2622553 RepID=UPI00267361BC|nr:MULTISPECIES: YceD family protein [unclassified Thermosynechococcus]MDR7921853.1 YceD family protein [Thermosynechococcus sp. HY213]WKT82411.1 YceD family protein [Thermosynechococcus sp. PP45]WNC26028.1 YceD family protein [Thermosynechococcus sp. PP551]WNC28608.1 YceD family protein [Thermosynechococcus sp. PP555]WNC53929.1 YceD family protein [Thermosynechococcus sp. TG215]
MSDAHWLSIPDLLRLPAQTYEWRVDTDFPDLATLTPVQGMVTASHRHTYLEVSASVQTIVTLSCDRCLQYYNHRLVCTTTELIWLAETPASQPDDDLVETLPANGRIDLADWLYQQLCLALPYPQYCDPNCGGIHPPVPADPPIDHRWAMLAQLQSVLERSEPSP